jgi:hypothetical protein
MIAGLPGAGLSTLFYAVLLLGIGAAKVRRGALRFARRLDGAASMRTGGPSPATASTPGGERPPGGSTAHRRRADPGG